MSQHLEDRVGALERETVRQGEQLGQVKAEVSQVRADVGKVAAGVDRLLEREAARPQSLTGKTIAATCAGLLSIAAVGWWLVGSSPAVVDLGRRLDRLDDPQVGRVPALERKVDQIGAWQVRVTRN